MFKFLTKQIEFRNLLEMKWQKLYRVAYSWCHDPQLAADLVQDTIVKALKARHQLNDIKAMNSWLFRILANCWHDYLRAQKDNVVLEEDKLFTEMGPGDENDRLNIVNKVRNAISKLKRDQREVLTLVDLEGFAYNEVAEVLGIPIGTVMSRLCRARNNLKQQLTYESHQNLQESVPYIWRVK